ADEDLQVVLANAGRRPSHLRSRSIEQRERAWHAHLAIPRRIDRLPKAPASELLIARHVIDGRNRVSEYVSRGYAAEKLRLRQAEEERRDRRLDRLNLRPRCRGHVERIPIDAVQPSGRAVWRGLVHPGNEGASTLAARLP